MSTRTAEYNLDVGCTVETVEVIEDAGYELSRIRTPTSSV
jgi:hypothetical protein